MGLKPWFHVEKLAFSRPRTN